VSSTVASIPSTADTPERFGAALRERRRELGITQARLADVTGVSRQAVIDLERGKPNARWHIALQLARALGLDVTLQPR
jgi:HTH-type transcriptional regulator / antitoxin HipB